MYIWVSMLKKVTVGEPLVLEKDFEYGEIAIKTIGGGIVGFVMHNQPEGCLNFFDALKKIGAKKIISTVIMASGDAAVLYSHSTVLASGIKRYDGNGLYTAII